MVAATCHGSLCGWRLLVCQPVDENGSDLGAPVIALDQLGAGMHQQVILSSDGKGAQELTGDKHSPARYFTIGVLDHSREAVA